MKLDLNNYTTFGNLLQKLCNQKGVTIRDVSKNISLSPAYICDIQNGNRRPPKDEILLEIFKYFNINEIEQQQLLDLVHLEKQELDNETAIFLKNNKKALKIIKQITKIKNFDELVKENPVALINLQAALDELTIFSEEKRNESRF